MDGRKVVRSQGRKTREMRKYNHLERLGHDNVDGIDIGTVHIFPKLDGTNARVWPRQDRVIVGSRNRELTPEDDHFGFAKWAHKQYELFRNMAEALGALDHLIFYGEWLIYHTLKTYRDEAWNKFYLFDVYHLEEHRYLSIGEYLPVLERFTGGDFQIVPCMVTATNPSKQQLQDQLEKNNYLIKDGCGAGEGIVIKNYDWHNTNGHQTWAKIVRNEFREQNKLVFGTPKLGEAVIVEAVIADHYVTPTLVAKERAKLQHLERKSLIPALLSSVFRCIVVEELWNALKKLKNPTIDFKKLQRFCVMKTKEYAKDLF